jgi:hypothetical protein
VVCCIIKARESDTYRSNKGWPSALLLKKKVQAAFFVGGGKND